jgi:hypothetical protein
MNARRQPLTPAYVPESCPHLPARATWVLHWVALILASAGTQARAAETLLSCKASIVSVNVAFEKQTNELTARLALLPEGLVSEVEYPDGSLQRFVFDRARDESLTLGYYRTSLSPTNEAVFTNWASASLYRGLEIKDVNPVARMLFETVRATSLLQEEPLTQLVPWGLVDTPGSCSCKRIVRADQRAINISYLWNESKWKQEALVPWRSQSDRDTVPYKENDLLGEVNIELPQPADPAHQQMILRFRRHLQYFSQGLLQSYEAEKWTMNINVTSQALAVSAAPRLRTNYNYSISDFRFADTNMPHLNVRYVVSNLSSPPDTNAGLVVGAFKRTAAGYRDFVKHLVPEEDRNKPSRLPRLAAVTVIICAAVLPLLLFRRPKQRT